MTLRLAMTFKPVFVSTLLFAGLAVPLEAVSKRRIAYTRLHAYHLRRWRPFDFILFAIAFELPGSALGMFGVRVNDFQKGL